MPRPATTRTSAMLTAFALTGLGIGLLGAILPALLAGWHLSDASGGSLMLATWGGTTSGTFFSRGRLDRTIERGTLLVSGSLLLLALSPSAMAYALFFLYGLGLGVMMTSISLLRSQQAVPERRALELNRLNMLWALGAIASPWVAGHALRTLHVSGLFYALSAVFLASALALRLTRDRESQTTIHALRWRDTFARIPVVFAVAAALAVGVESAVGGWLTTYAQRTAHAATLSVSATSAFWAGLLLSRAFAAGARSRWFAPARFAVFESLLAAVALVLLLATPHRGGLLPLALLIGFGLGPLYPYVLSLALPRFPGNTVFLSAGLGAAVVPWLTGAASGGAGSLRAGLLVPCVGAAMMLATLPFLRGERHLSPDGTRTAPSRAPARDCS